MALRPLLPIVALALVLRWLPVAAPVDWLDVRFVPDDTYYLLAIARSLAEGHGPTADGLTLTNGFQPLIVFLLTPVVALLGSSDLVLRVLWLGLGSADTGSVLLLGLLGARLGGARAGQAAALLWATSPLALRAALGGMETSLALFLGLAVVEGWCRALERPEANLRWAVAGGLCGLALLARVDLGVLIGLLGSAELLGGHRRGVLLAAGTAVLVVAPWWGWSVYYLGSFFPESGRAVRELGYLYQGDQVHRNAMVWAAGALLPGPSLDVGPLRLAFLLPVLGEGLTLLTLLGAAWLARAALVAAGGPVGRPLRVFLLFALLLPVLYTLLVPGIWFFLRYLVPTVAASALGLGLVWGRASPAGWSLPVLASAVLGLASFGLRFGPTYRMQDVAAIEGTSGYLVEMREAVRQLPAGPVVVGSLQSGALAWVAPPGVTVVNLDGVVDSRSFQALREGRLEDRLREAKVAYFIDWRLQHDKLLERSTGVELEALWTSERPMCSGHRLILSRVVLP